MKFTVDPAAKVATYTMPGMYPMYYITADYGSLCPDCVNAHRTRCADPNDPQWHVILADINYEDEDLRCEHCSVFIEPAHGKSAE